MSTHHKRWGGRGLELLLLLALLCISLALIVGAILFIIYIHSLLFDSSTGGSKDAGLVLIGGPVLGGWLARPLWQRYLRYYKYGSDLRPMKDGPSGDMSK